MAPGLKHLKDGEEFFVVYVVVEFNRGKQPEVEQDWVDTVFQFNGEDGAKGVVGGISFNNDQDVGDPLCKGRSGGESLLERVEGILALVRSNPRGVFLGQTSERDGDVGVEQDKSAVEVCKAKERPDVPYLTGGWPLDNIADFDRVHSKFLKRQDIFEILHGVRVEFALVRTEIQPVFLELAENFLNVLLMFF